MFVQYAEIASQQGPVLAASRQVLRLWLYLGVVVAIARRTAA